MGRRSNEEETEETGEQTRGRRVVQGGKCGVCAASFKRGQEVAVCVECRREAHKSCTGLKRWKLDRGQEWRCAPCRGDVDGEETVRERARGPEGGKCDECKRWS